MSKFWVEDISQLFAFKSGLVPSVGKTLEDNLNCITRLAILLTIVIMLFKPVLAFGTLCVSVVVIMAIYYSMKHAVAEPFLPETELIGCTEPRFCGDLRPIKFDEEHFSLNQMLLGKANPKTFIPPIIAPHSHDISWRYPETTTKIDVYEPNSGFVPTTSGSGPRKCLVCVRSPCMCFVKFPTFTDKVHRVYEDPINYDNNDDNAGYQMEEVPPLSLNTIDQRSYDTTGAGAIPNFISRNDVDVYPWAPQNKFGFSGSFSAADREECYKLLAEKSFLDSSTKFRTDLQESMRLQCRVSPIMALR